MKFKLLLKKILNNILGNPSDSAAWFFRLLILILLIKLAFFNERRVITNFPEDFPYKDSIRIEKYKVQVLENYLIKTKEQNEKDSINLTIATLDSLISYIANK